MAIAIQHASGNDDAFTQRLAPMLASEIVVGLANLSMTVNRAGYLRQGMGKKNQRLGGGTPHRRSIGLVQRVWLAARFMPPVGPNGQAFIRRLTQSQLLKQIINVGASVPLVLMPQDSRPGRFARCTISKDDLEKRP